MGLNNQNLSRNKILLGVTQRNGYKLDYETLRLSNFSTRMGFRVSFDAHDQVKCEFLEPSVSVTKTLSYISQ